MEYFILVKRNNTNDINCHSSKGVYLIMHKICGSGVKFGPPQKKLAWWPPIFILFSNRYNKCP